MPLPAALHHSNACCGLAYFMLSAATALLVSPFRRQDRGDVFPMRSEATLRHAVAMPARAIERTR